MLRRFTALGAINMALAVGLGAFGAHGLEDRLEPNMMSAYETGVQYHLVHALGLILIALVADKLPGSSWVRRSGMLILIGIILFSGSLYIMSVTGVTKLGIITPFGGVAFLAGWASLAAASLGGSKSNK